MNTQLLADYLASEKNFLVSQAESAADAILAVMGSEKPDVVLLSPIFEDDPAMGLRVARQLRALHPDAPIVMLLDASTYCPNSATCSSMITVRKY
jgi:DNA-binding NarL/FixJ family response regulator